MRIRPAQRPISTSEHWRAPHNWPLRLGSAIALLVFGAALIGPMIAPRDPLLQNFALRVRGDWIGPPFPPFANWDYPLGSDQFGRDLWSRLLWAVRPTMILVVIVAGVRLVLGTLLGLVAGWSIGWPGRTLETLIGGALSVPVLLVALATIAGVGIERGLVAFVLALSLTGWAETGRIVGIQTRGIRQRPFIESSRALGASGAHILFYHVLRHVMPLLGMLLAFEISSTLLIVGSLGFLGYYIGGGVWMQVGDYVKQNTTGLPELGQMLATSLVKLTVPWPMLVVGSVVFMIVLGFNLLGQGLRRRMDPERPRNRTRLGRAAAWVGSRLGDVARPVVRPMHDYPAVALLTLVLLGGVGLFWRRARTANETASTPLAVAGASETAPPAAPTTPPQLWASQDGNAAGTFWSAADTITVTTTRTLFKAPEGGFSGGPAVATDGTLYVASDAGVLYALNEDGSMRWQATIPATPVGGPALSPDGDVYVVDRNSTLSAWGPDGTLRWQVQPKPAREATSGAIAGPDGTIYFTSIDAVQAISPAGQALWRSPAADGYIETAPRLSPDGALVFLKAAAYDTKTGEARDFTINQEPGQEFALPSYVIGADGGTYYLSGHGMTAWKATADGVEVGQTHAWEHGGTAIEFPAEAGVTRDGAAWYFYGADDFRDTRIVWLDRGGKLMSNVFLPLRNSRPIGIDANSVMYFCGQRRNSQQQCSALRAGDDEPLWQVGLEGRSRITGGALVHGRLYVTTEDGGLLSIGAETASSATR